MKIAIVFEGVIPIKKYGGSNRVVWALGKELSALGHKVTFMGRTDFKCNFARVLKIDPDKNLFDQVPKDVDITHYFKNPFEVPDNLPPHIVTMEGNTQQNDTHNLNSVYVSKNHARMYGSESFVYNGIDWSGYLDPDFTINRPYFHFLAKAAWKVKNLKGSIEAIEATEKEKLRVMGGSRLNLKMGIRFYTSTRTRFHGMVGGKKKDEIIKHSSGLLFPVLWNEPFGIAITESLYYGCPVFGTPYGSLPELIGEEYGFLSNSKSALANAIENVDKFDRKACHHYANTEFDAKTMTLRYLELYEKVIANEKLNTRAPQRVPERNKKSDFKWLD